MTGDQMNLQNGLTSFHFLRDPVSSSSVSSIYCSTWTFYHASCQPELTSRPHDRQPTRLPRHLSPCGGLSGLPFPSPLSVLFKVVLSKVSAFCGSSLFSPIVLSMPHNLAETPSSMKPPLDQFSQMRSFLNTSHLATSSLHKYQVWSIYGPNSGSMLSYVTSSPHEVWFHSKNKETQIHRILVHLPMPSVLRK